MRDGLLRLGLALVLTAPLSHAQSVEPIATVLTDQNGDHVPDRVGERVTVAGRATTDRGALGLLNSTTLTDGHRAIWLHDFASPGVAAGDSLVATGTLSFWNGSALLEGPEVRRIEAEARVPSPLAVPTGDLETLEGRLIEVEGVVAGVSDVERGQALMLTLPDQTLIVVFAFAARTDPIDLSRYSPGQRLRVTGIASQFDRVAPYDGGYQLYPRSQADIQPAGLHPRLILWTSIGALALLALAVGWILLLRAQVRQRVEEVLRTDTRYRMLLRNASDAVFVHDLQGNGIEVNPAAVQAFGLTDADAPPSLLDVVEEEHQDRVMAHLIMLQAQGTARCDLHLRAGSGAPRVFEFESTLIDVGGDRHVLSLARNVVLRRAYEAELIVARREAEEIARLKSTLLANMSHEIRTPLTAVIGYAEILTEEVDAPHRELAEVIQQGGQRLLRTLNSVLDLARLDAGTVTLQPVPLDLGEQARQSATLVRALADARGLALSVDAPSYPVIAEADPGALDRILTNLIGNALKFTEEGGVTVSLHATEAEATFRIADTGIGIDEAFLPNLFSEFRQESEGAERSHEGSGLGLAITARLVEMMGGRIEVESEKGVGSTFAVTLPRRVATGTAGDGAAVADAPALPA